MENQKWMTIKEVADLLRVLPPTVRRWVRLGYIPQPKAPAGNGRKWIFNRADLEKSVEEHWKI